MDFRSIYGNALAQPVKSVSEFDAERDRAKMNQLAMQDAIDQRAQRKAALERQNALMGVYQQGLQGEQLQNALLKHGALDESLKIGRDMRENAKLEAETKAKQAERSKVKYGAVRELVQGAYLAYDDALKQTKDPRAAAEAANRAYLGGVQQLRGVGMFDDNDVQNAGQFDPNVAKSFLDRDKEIQMRMQAARDAEAAANNLRVDQRVKSEGAANRAVTMRGQNLTDARARETNQVTREGNLSKRTQDVEMKLADDYRMESKGFAETSTAMRKVLGALETADKNPGSALAAGTAFMKILDPNSVVRESELGMALNASGWFDRAANVAQVMQSGRVMTPEQKANLRAAAQQLFEDAKRAQLEVDSAYRARAERYGANPDNIITDRGQAKGQKPPLGSFGGAGNRPPLDSFLKK